MKKTIIYMLAAVAAAGFTACDDNFVQPPLEDYVPHSELTPNTTIRELKEAFFQEKAAYSTEIGTKENGEHYIVKGRFVSNDASANLYKKLSITDETGALILSINGSGLSETYKFGQEVVIDLTGLYYGNYDGNNLVGGFAAATEGPSRMLKSKWESVAQLDGMPDVAAVDTVVMTLSELAALRANPIDVDLAQGLLVRINGLHFRNPGSPLGDSSRMNNSTTMLDASGQQLTLNTCGYGMLWGIEAPQGEGDIVGILSNYGREGYTPVWQVNLIDAYSLIGFEGYDPANPIKPVLPQLYSETFLAGQGAWTVDNVSLSPGLSFVWKQDASYGMVASAYNAGTSYASDSWLVSPVFDCTSASDMVLSFEHCANKWSGGSGTEDYKSFMKLFVKVDGGSWQELAIPYYSDNTSWSYVSSGDISLADCAGHASVQLGFQYTSLDGYSGTWEIRNLSIDGNGSLTVK
ncbi:MAG: choice-of-anchor J domain-containing protein [Muribaculaceae bacterium]|nr:choice-of-anchor J domain-containing protein [Muribaculaceae bacterium]